MLPVYRNAKQVRDRKLFRAWLFKIAHHTLYRHYAKSNQEVEALSLSDMESRSASGDHQPGRPAFEFQGWLPVSSTFGVTVVKQPAGQKQNPVENEFAKKAAYESARPYQIAELPGNRTSLEQEGQANIL